MTKILMIQGTMSNVGKSLITAGLCRAFSNMGYSVSPFKSQNMALNSYITKDGKEIGRAQALQAEACRKDPSVLMNPILLKPTTDIGSQVIINGEAYKNMSAREYFKFKKSLMPEIKTSFNTLAKDSDIIIIEGAGSPAEVNLKSDDIVNMGLAKELNCPVLLIGDIDRGGVFAQLLGTLMLLEDDERSLVKGLVINKFRGDKTLLDSGIKIIEDKGNKPVLGLVEYHSFELEEEDSLSNRFRQKELSLINIGVIKLPKISNYTDFLPFENIDGVTVHYITNPDMIDSMDMLIIPGSKNTIEDLQWLYKHDFVKPIKEFASTKLLFGICGGLQILGKSIKDPNHIESKWDYIEGLNMLDIETILNNKKYTSQTSGNINTLFGMLKNISGLSFNGYEIHNGSSNFSCPIIESFNVYGTYIHGIFDSKEIISEILSVILRNKGLDIHLEIKDFNVNRDKELNALADLMSKSFNLNKLLTIMGDYNE